MQVLKKIAISLIFCLTPACANAQNAETYGEVVGIQDGDTIKVFDGKKTEKIQLAGIDCPEKEQAYGKEAEAFTAKKVFRKEVIVVAKERDGYGRLLAEVYYKENDKNVSLNNELLSNGFAWWYAHFYPQRTDLEALQKQAKENRIGLWQDENPISPFDFRSKQKEKIYQTRSLSTKPAKQNIRLSDDLVPAVTP